MGTKCYLLERTNKVERHLRVYESGDCNRENHSYHNSMFFLDRIEGTFNQEGYIETKEEDWDRNDPRFKMICDHCGGAFISGTKQLFIESLYIDTRNGNLVTIKSAEPGAMWDAWWMSKHCKDSKDNMWVGPEDRKSLMCKLPDGHEWHIDGQASNCTMKNDHIHKCWVRHGTPPNLTVDKNGHTCQAGAGSIQSPKWHGFLTNGILDIH